MKDWLNKTHIGTWQDLAKQLPDNIFDAMLLDPPFDMTQQDWDKSIDLEECWKEWKRLIKDNGVILIKAKSKFEKLVACSNLEMYRYDWIWLKNKPTGHLNKNIMPMQETETILVFYKSLPVFNPQKTAGHKPMNYAKRKAYPANVYGESTKESISDVGSTERYPTNAIYFPVVNNDDPERIHPNQTPVNLWRYFLRTYTNKGAVVADFFAGSFSVSKACIMEGRNYVAVESNEEHYKNGTMALSNIQRPLIFLD